MNRQQAIEFLLNRPADFGKMLGFTKLSSLHNEWIKWMVRGKEDSTLQASRGTFKTTCDGIALAIILILLPNKRTAFIRKTDTDTREIIKQVQKILLDPHTQYFVEKIYGVRLTLTTQNTSEVSTNLTNDVRGSAQLIGLGIGSSITGKHFDYIFTDDIVNIQDRVSKAERDRTKLFYQELQNIRNPDGRTFNSGTPWHQDDAFSIMPEAKKYDCYYPEIKKIISEERLKELRDSMLPSLFAANYELRHIASEDVIFTEPKTGGDISMLEQSRYTHVDAAYGGEDYTAYTIAAKKDGVYYVLGKLWRKHVDDCEDEIIALRKSLNCGRIYCEDNGDKGYLAKQFRAKNERVVLYHENMNKFLKITSYLKAEWKNVVFVNGTDDAYIQQICDYNENAEHDDAPDSLASIIRLLWQKKSSDTERTSIWG